MIVSAATITVNKISGCKQNDLPAYFIKALYHHGVQYGWKNENVLFQVVTIAKNIFLEKISLIIFNKVKMDKNAWFAKTGIKDLRLTKIPHNTRVTSIFISRINLVSVPVVRKHDFIENYPKIDHSFVLSRSETSSVCLQQTYKYQCYNLIVALISWIIQIHIRIY